MSSLAQRARTFSLENAYQALLTLGLAVLGFFLMFSSAGTSIALALLALLCIVAPVRIWRVRPWRHPVHAAGLLLLAFIVVRSLLEPSVTGRPSVLAANGYHELLMAPLLFALLRVARRPQAFSIGVVAGALWLAASYALRSWLPDRQEWFTMHRISAGFGMAVCAYLLFEHARLARLPAVFGYGAAAFLTGVVLFATDGRTGLLVLLVLVLCAAFRAARRWRMLTIAGVVVAMVALAASSHLMRQRLLETWRDTGHPTTVGQPASSTTIRVEILRNSLAVARSHWLAGVGWNHYQQAMEQAGVQRNGDAPALPRTRINNPHNEYLLQLGAGGVGALGLFLLWLAAPVILAVRNRHLDRPWAGVIAGVAVAFALGCLFNSWLLDFTEGHIYAALLAWLLARREEAGSRQPTTQP